MPIFPRVFFGENRERWQIQKHLRKFSDQYKGKGKSVVMKKEYRLWLDRAEFKFQL